MQITWSCEMIVDFFNEQISLYGTKTRWWVVRIATTAQRVPHSSRDYSIATIEETVVLISWRNAHPVALTMNIHTLMCVKTTTVQSLWRLLACAEYTQQSSLRRYMHLESFETPPWLVDSRECFEDRATWTWKIAEIHGHKPAAGRKPAGQKPTR